MQHRYDPGNPLALQPRPDQHSGFAGYDGTAQGSTSEVSSLKLEKGRSGIALVLAADSAVYGSVVKGSVAVANGDGARSWLCRRAAGTRSPSPCRAIWQSAPTGTVKVYVKPGKGKYALKKPLRLIPGYSGVISIGVKVTKKKATIRVKTVYSGNGTYTGSSTGVNVVTVK